MAQNACFSKRLKELRAEKGITQKVLAQELGISLSSVINYENNQRFPVSGVLALIQKYFNVSREYLTGKSNERTPEYKWDDSEGMEAVREILPALLQNLNKTASACSVQEQKLFFDMLVELYHVLKLDDPNARTVSISLLQDVFTASTRFIDVCLGAGKGMDAPARLDKAKTDALSHFEHALTEAQKILPL